MYLFLDIETVPVKITDEFVKEYFMDKKISKELRSLNPNYSKIITISLKTPNELKNFHGDDEEKILGDFWKYLIEHKDIKIVTHNGYGFDIPFLTIRSVLNNVKIPIRLNTNKFSMENSNHFDTMIFFSQNIFTNPNLTILAKMNNIEVPENNINAKDVEKLYKEKNWEKIKERCENDVLILEKVFNKLCLPYLEH